MLHYRIHSFLRFLYERAAIKAKDFTNIWKAVFDVFWTFLLLMGMFDMVSYKNIPD